MNTNISRRAIGAGVAVLMALLGARGCATGPRAESPAGTDLRAIVVVDLRSQRAKRVLENDASVKPEPSLELKVEGNVLIDPEKGRPLAIASDGLAIDREGGWLYYKALTGHTLYRVRLADLEASFNGGASELGNRVERVGQVPASDGLAASMNIRPRLWTVG